MSAKNPVCSGCWLTSSCGDGSKVSRVSASPRSTARPVRPCLMEDCSRQHSRLNSNARRERGSAKNNVHQSCTEKAGHRTPPCLSRPASQSHYRAPLLSARVREPQQLPLALLKAVAVPGASGRMQRSRPTHLSHYPWHAQGEQPAIQAFSQSSQHCTATDLQGIMP